MRIQHNIPAMNAYRNFRTNSSLLSKNLEKLSSGYRINRAGDDAAGLAISEKMRAQISGLSAAQSNAKDGISLVQTAEGALTEVHDMLNRMVTLAEQSSNGTYGDTLDREQLQKEVDQLRDEINRIADSANFNGIKLLDGSMDVQNAKEATSVTTISNTFDFTDGEFTTDHIADTATAAVYKLAYKMAMGSGTSASVNGFTFTASDVGTAAGSGAKQKENAEALAKQFLKDNANDIAEKLGVNTLLHKEGIAAGKASFYVDLNNFTVSDSGTFTIAFGASGSGGVLKAVITGSDVGSDKSLQASDLVNKIVSSVKGTGTSAVATLGSVQYNISAEGDRLKFESVNNVTTTIATHVEINMDPTKTTSYAAATLASATVGSKSGAEVSFVWARGADAASDAVKAAFVGAASQSNTTDFSFKVTVDQALNSLSGNAAKSDLVVNSGASTVTCTVSGSGNSVTITNKGTGDGGEAITYATLKQYKVDVVGKVVNGAATVGTFSIQKKLQDVASTVAAGNDSATAVNVAAGNTTTATSFAINIEVDSLRTDIENTINTITDMVAASGSKFGIELDLNSIGAKTTAGSDISYNVDTLSVGAAAGSSDTISISFKVTDSTSLSTEITMKFRLDEIASRDSSDSNNWKSDAATIKAAIASTVKNVFGRKVTDTDTSYATDTVKLSIASLSSDYIYKAQIGTQVATLTAIVLETGYRVIDAGASAGVKAGKLVLDSNEFANIDVYSKVDGAAGPKIGTFKVDFANLKDAEVKVTDSNGNTTGNIAEYYDHTATSARSGDDTITYGVGYETTKLIAGKGDYNVSTQVIVPGAAESMTKLASTRIGVDTSATSASAVDADGKIQNAFFGKIKDGAALKIGDETYVFAVGEDSTLTEASGAILVNLRDVENDASNGLASKALKTALKRLTVAAKDNEMFHVGYSEAKNELTLTENRGYYTASNGAKLLNTASKIAGELAFGTVKQITEVSTTPAFDAKNLILQIGDTSDSYNQLEVSIMDMHTDKIGIGSIDISTQKGAQEAVDKIKAAINYVSDVRGGLGATQNRLEHTINNLSVMVENITDAESTIRDTDIASEMMAYTKNSILNQAAQAMLAQANQLPQGVLQLLG